MTACWNRIAALIVLLAGTLVTSNPLETRQWHQQQLGPWLKTAVTAWKAEFTPQKIEMHMGTTMQVQLEIIDIVTTKEEYSFRLGSEHPHLATVQAVIPAASIDPESGVWRGNITVEALFLGETHIYVERVDKASNATERSDHVLDVTIIRRMRIIDHVFAGSVALLVSLLYINFGAALDLGVLRSLAARPIGPTIGFITQFVMMPLLSYLLGYLIFPNSPEMQLGLFFTGCSPSGGASNIWTVILNGNINLSILMTTIGNFAAFGMMPLWLLTLGHYIFERANMVVPYAKIATFAVSLVVPLAIGLAIQKFSPRLSNVLVRLLKPISASLIIFIIVFAIVTNLYLFDLFSWQIALAGLALPWLGYIIGWLLAKIMRQNANDALTIAIETGIQNTGIAIFLLRFGLPQPQADLTTVVPVSIAIMTPLPLLGLYIFKRITERNIKDGIIADRSTLD